MAKGREVAAEALNDRIDTLLVLMEGCDTVECVVDKIARMFADDAPTLTLSTVHKAKGREWGRVYILGRREHMPSPYARQDWQRVQEDNLIYVAITRAQRELVLVD
jgi:DNA helicase II / ATP-dependent DNA helicase PcrA